MSAAGYEFAQSSDETLAAGNDSLKTYRRRCCLRGCLGCCCISTCGLFIFGAALMACAMAGSMSSEPENVTLPGTQTFAVQSAQKWNEGPRVIQGVGYQLQVRGDQAWMDWYISASAEGYPSVKCPQCWYCSCPILEWWSATLAAYAQPRSRYPDARMFELVCALDRDIDTAFAVGEATEFVAERTGELTCFANDDEAAYWNNYGQLKVMLALQ